MLWTLFKKFFMIGLFSFGGGYAMLPLFEKEFIRSGIITNDRFLEIMTISQMTPGSFAINAATFIGKDNGGFLGALREDEIACRSLGLSPRRIKLTAFTISAAFAGFAGTLFAARQGFVSPESFTFAESAFVLALVVLGGMGSQFAVILAAVLLVVSRELMRDFNEYSMLMLGGLMVLMMIWRPQGLLPMTRPQLKLKNGAAKGEQA